MTNPLKVKLLQFVDIVFKSNTILSFHPPTTTPPLSHGFTISVKLRSRVVEGRIPKGTNSVYRFLQWLYLIGLFCWFCKQLCVQSTTCWTVIAGVSLLIHMLTWHFLFVYVCTWCRQSATLLTVCWKSATKGERVCGCVTKDECGEGMKWMEEICDP